MKATRPMWQSVVFLLISGFLAYTFGLSGISKLMGAEFPVQAFGAFGLPLWFMTVTGVVEVLAVVLVLIPQTRFYGGVLIAATMVGAALIHIITGIGLGTLVTNGYLFALAALLAWTHRPSWLKALLSSSDGERLEGHRPLEVNDV